MSIMFQVFPPQDADPGRAQNAKRIVNRTLLVNFNEVI